MGELDKGPRTSTLPPKDEILVVMVQDMAVCLERPTTTPCLMLDRVLISLREIDLGLGQPLLPPIIQVIML